MLSKPRTHKHQLWEHLCEPIWSCLIAPLHSVLCTILLSYKGPSSIRACGNHTYVCRPTEACDAPEIRKDEISTELGPTPSWGTNHSLAQRPGSDHDSIMARRSPSYQKSVSSAIIATALTNTAACRWMAAICHRSFFAAAPKLPLFQKSFLRMPTRATLSVSACPDTS
ncbi:hypothetical protein H4582DRAFT_705720 [Lactarius indigo]|nr:hypothetical protein H4582DRAFT_705720 [Lactarius indigo]